MKPLKILDRYIIGKFILTFVVAIVLIIAVVIVVDFSESIQSFLDKKVPVSKIIGYYLNFTPYFVNLFIPLFTFISVIYFTSKLSGNSEIIAMSNGGMSFYRMLYPYLLSVVVIGGLSVGLDNYIIPKSSKKMMYFKDQYLSKQIHSKDSDTHLKLSDNTYAFVHYWDAYNSIGYAFWYEEMGENGIRRKLSSQTIQWDSVAGYWHLANYTDRYFDGSQEILKTGKEMNVRLPMRTSDFVYFKHGPNIMTTPEIKKYIEVERAKGSDNLKAYEVELHRRMTGLPSVLILTIVGVCVSSRRTREGMGLHLLVGLVITFSYVLLQQMCQVFAVYGGMSPVLSVWIPDMLYAVLCVILVIKTPK